MFGLTISEESYLQVLAEAKGPVISYRSMRSYPGAGYHLSRMSLAIWNVRNAFSDFYEITDKGRNVFKQLVEAGRFPGVSTG